LAAALASAAEPAQAQVNTQAHIVIVGGGTGGIAMSNRLARGLRGARITLIDASERHDYKPGFPMVGGGVWSVDRVLMEPTSHYLPRGINWVKDYVAEFDPTANTVVTRGGQRIRYDFLVVATGLQMNWGAIQGMDVAALGQNGLTSVYAGAQASADTWKLMDTLRRTGGRLVTSVPQTPIRCGGAPVIMAYLFEDQARSAGTRDRVDIHFYTALGTLLGQPDFNRDIQRRFGERDIGFSFRQRLTGIDIGARRATFTAVPEGGGARPAAAGTPAAAAGTPAAAAGTPAAAAGTPAAAAGTPAAAAGAQTTTVDYDFIHVVPPMSANDSVRNSDLAWKEGPFAGGGWLEVNRETLQHRRFPNVFGIGDINGTPRGKSAATIKGSAPIVAHNLIRVIQDQLPDQQFNGYSSCPLVTRVGSAQLLEIDYDGNLIPSIPFVDPLADSFFAWVMKDRLLKPAYVALLRGRI
jgi:sulfide:quinone oxidoreductase